MIDIADLKRNVQWLNAGLATTFILGLGALITLYFTLSIQIENRFDKADAKIGAISQQVGDLRVAIAGQGGDIKVILEKVDASKPAQSERTKSAK